MPAEASHALRGVERACLIWDWGISEAKLDPAVVERMGINAPAGWGGPGAAVERTALHASTPAKFRDLLIDIARGCFPRRTSL